MAKRRRSPVEGGRPLSVRVALSVGEMAEVSVAAVRAGLSVGAWLGEVGVRDARVSARDSAAALTGRGGRAVGVAASAPTAGVPDPVSGTGAGSWGALLREVMMLRAELAEDRRVLRNIGGNWNDVARHANATGVLHPGTAQVGELVVRAVRRVEDTVVRVDELAAGAQDLARADRLAHTSAWPPR